MSRTYAWCFTLNNPTVTAEQLSATLLAKTTYFAFQEEYVTCRHFQGYVEFANNKQATYVHKLIPRAHWEARKGTQEQADVYARKEETRVAGPWVGGTLRPLAQGTRSDLSSAIATMRTGGIAAVRVEHPEVFVRYHRGLERLNLATISQPDSAPTVTLLFGPPGTGKTRAYYDAEGDTGCHLLCSSGFWFDGYEQNDAILFDDFDGRASKWTLAQCLLVLDRYHIRVPIKGSYTRYCPKRIYITTNVHPSEWYDFSGRRQQYPALVRRFTNLVWWKHEPVRGAPLPTPVRLDADDPEFARFFLGRDGAQRILDVDSGLLVSRAPTSDYFDF